MRKLRRLGAGVISCCVVLLLIATAGCDTGLMSSEPTISDGSNGGQESPSPDPDKAIVSVSVPVLSSTIAAVEPGEDLTGSGELSSKSLSSKAFIGVTKVELSITDSESNEIASWTENPYDQSLSGGELITSSSPQIPPVNNATVTAEIYNENVSSSNPMVSGSASFSIDSGDTANVTITATPVNPTQLDLSSSTTASHTVSSMMPMLMDFAPDAYVISSVGGEHWFEISLPADVTGKAIAVQGDPGNDVYGAMALYDANGSFIAESFNHGRSYGLYSTAREKGSACDMIIPQSALSAAGGGGTFYLGVALLNDANTDSSSFGITTEVIEVTEESPEAMESNTIAPAENTENGGSDYTTITISGPGSGSDVVNGALQDIDYIELIPSSGPSSEAVTHYRASFSYQLDALNRGIANGYALDIVRQLDSSYAAESSMGGVFSLDDEARTGTATVIVPYDSRRSFPENYYFRVQPYTASTVESSYQVSWDSFDEVSNVDAGVNDYASGDPVGDDESTAIPVSTDTSIAAQLVGNRDVDVYSIDTSSLSGMQTISINFSTDATTAPYDLKDDFSVEGFIPDMDDGDATVDGQQSFELYDVDDGTIDFTARFDSGDTPTFYLQFFSDGANSFEYDFTVSTSPADSGAGVTVY